MSKSIDTSPRFATALIQLGTVRWLALIALLAFAWFPGLSSHAQAPAVAPPKAAASKPVVPVAVTKPDWSELTPMQKSALAPLQTSWTGISSGQKRKWIAMSANFASLTPSEKATMHGRMTEWTALGPEQRRQARLNFAQTKDVPVDEKKAQWQAYQALSPEQKRQLAAGAPATTGGAARAVTPVAPAKLAAVPITRSDPAHTASAARPHVASPFPVKPLSPASAAIPRP